MNKLVYDQVFTLTTGMFDEQESIKPYAILDIFQTIASAHADLLGCGTAFCNEHHYGWILARQECFIYQSPKPKDQVIVTTFPHKPGIIDFKREYIMKSLEGEILARGCALWVLVDFNTHKMVKTSNIYPDGEFVMETQFPGKVARPASVKEEGEFINLYQVKKSNIDVYHHMNNAKYAEVMFNYAELDASKIKYFAICYHNEIKEQTSMQIFKHVTGNDVYLTGCMNDTIIFTSVLKGA